MSDFKPGSLDETLEGAIDRYGLAHVLLCVSALCDEKAQHIRINWQDAKTARPWAAVARLVEKLAREANRILP